MKADNVRAAVAALRREAETGRDRPKFFVYHPLDFEQFVRDGLINEDGTPCSGDPSWSAVRSASPSAAPSVGEER